MADQDDAAENTGGGKKNLILFAVVLVVAIAGSVGGTIFFLGGSEEPAAEEVAETPANTVPTAVYHNMRPPYIINYLTGSKPRYLQAEISIMARNTRAIEAVITHMPLIRSRIINFLTEQNFLELQTQEGKEAVREGIVELINETLAEHEVVPGIESALLTNFVLQ